MADAIVRADQNLHVPVEHRFALRDCLRVVHLEIRRQKTPPRRPGSGLTMEDRSANARGGDHRHTYEKEGAHGSRHGARLKCKSRARASTAIAGRISATEDSRNR